MRDQDVDVQQGHHLAQERLRGNGAQIRRPRDLRTTTADTHTHTRTAQPPIQRNASAVAVCVSAAG
eukprot:3358356-Pyramimonas_sp.AAC.2